MSGTEGSKTSSNDAGREQSSEGNREQSSPGDASGVKPDRPDEADADNASSEVSESPADESLEAKSPAPIAEEPEEERTLQGKPPISSLPPASATDGHEDEQVEANEPKSDVQPVAANAAEPVAAKTPQAVTNADEEPTLQGNEQKSVAEAAGAPGFDDAPTRIMLASEKLPLVKAQRAAQLRARAPRLQGKLQRPRVVDTDEAPTLQGDEANALREAALGFDDAPTRIMTSAERSSFIESERAASGPVVPDVPAVPDLPLAAPSEWDEHPQLLTGPPEALGPVEGAEPEPSAEAASPPIAASSAAPPAPEASPVAGTGRAASIPPAFRARPRSSSPLWLLALLIPFVVAAILILNRPREASELSASSTATVPPTATASSLAAAASAEGDQRLAPTITDRAAAGEQAALQGLSSRPPDERRAEETLALAKGARIAKQRELEEFGQKLRARPELLRDRAELTRLRGYIDDGDTTVDALALLAQLPGPVAPDLLYNTWTNSRQRPETAQLAEGLLMSQEVGAKASPALKVLLDLQSAKECADVLQILSRAKLYADQRSVASLRKLNSRRGCGDQKLDDCYACLRKLETDPKAPSVNQVLIAARSRPAPTLP